METKLALITGASRGLGAALAEALAPGHHVIAVARTSGALEELDDRIRAAGGSATLALESPDRVRWSETGTMTWGDHVVEVERTLFVVRRGGEWFVEFSDGRPFHPWAVGRPVEHPCAADHYVGLIEVGEDGWTVEWRATGPEKDYVMTTVHSGHRPAHHEGPGPA